MDEHPELNTIVATPYDTSVDYNPANVMVVHKPLSVMSLAGIYNHEVFSQYDSPSSDEYYDFTAETAKVLIVDDNSINLTVWHRDCSNHSICRSTLPSAGMPP